MRRQLRNHARYRGRNDLNIVPMLDVMVILAFFLIFTAVFSKTSVLEVNLPGPGVQVADAQAALRARGDPATVRPRGRRSQRGRARDDPGRRLGPGRARLTEYLATLKQRVPDKANATLLVAEDVDYDTIVQVMDAVRVRQTVDGGKVKREPLFPQIALGDAPT